MVEDTNIDLYHMRKAVCKSPAARYFILESSHALLRGRLCEASRDGHTYMHTIIVHPLQHIGARSHLLDHLPTQVPTRLPTNLLAKFLLCELL